jgi:ubiquitin-protein ligase
MENPRLNRLNTDYAKIKDLVSRSPFVHIIETHGTPPEEYTLRLTCKGIKGVDSNDRPEYSEEHVLKINLPPEYPRKAPRFEMQTPVWHPNVARSGAVCIGDAGDHGYSPAMGLDDLVLRIIEIIRYENWNPHSAYNGTAAVWAEKNKRHFPVDTRQIVLEEIDIDIIDISISPMNPDNDLLDEIIIT